MKCSTAEAASEVCLENPLSSRTLGPEIVPIGWAGQDPVALKCASLCMLTYIPCRDFVRSGYRDPFPPQHHRDVSPPSSSEQDSSVVPRVIFVSEL